PDRVPTYLAKAFRTMLTGRPGPVFLEVPWDVLSNGVEESEARLPVSYRTRARQPGDPAFVDRAGELLSASARPVIVAGSSIHWDDAAAPLAAFAERLGAPVYLNGAGRGCLPADHPHFFSQTRKDALGEADVVVIAGKVIALRKPGRWLDPGPLGCLGVGAPFGIAAKLLHPDRPLFVIQGDGSFGFNGMDFDTALRFRLPMVVVVGNDAAWGQI